MLSPSDALSQNLRVGYSKNADRPESVAAQADPLLDKAPRKVVYPRAEGDFCRESNHQRKLVQHKSRHQDGHDHKNPVFGL